MANLRHRIRTRRISAATTIRISRWLPTPGEILVSPGQKVAAEETIAQSHAPNNFMVIDLAREWGIPVHNVSDFLVKEINSPVEAEEVIAERPSRLPFLRKSLLAPVDGVLKIVAGKFILIETEAQQETLSAAIAGHITEIIPHHGVIIETVGAYIEAMCGFGGTTKGILKSPSYDPLANLEVDSFALLDRQTVFMAGGTISEEAIRHAEEVGVAGIIVGSLAPSLLKMDPPAKIPVVATEGFGHQPMAMDTFAILQAREGDDVFVQGYMPSLHAPLHKRSLIIIPGLQEQETPLQSPLNGLIEPESQVRILRGPHRMQWGSLADTPPQSESKQTGGGLRYPGTHIQLSEEVVYVPWLNLEQMG